MEIVGIGDALTTQQDIDPEFHDIVLTWALASLALLMSGSILHASRGNTPPMRIIGHSPMHAEYSATQRAASLHQLDKKNNANPTYC
jgi:hypothetical protein